MKLFQTIKETLISSLPLAVIIIVCLLVAPMEDPANYARLLAGYVSVVVGQALFLVGLDASILPIGHMVGTTFSKYKKIILILLFGFLFGLLATVAEPAISVLARQITQIIPVVNSTLFIWITATGIGIGVAVALFRIIRDINIKLIFGVLYALVFALVLFSPAEFIAVAFDGSGATTGDVSVPFILALGIGISATFSRGKTNDDSLGIIGIASVGPIIAVLLYGVLLKAACGGVLPPENAYDAGRAASLGAIISGNLRDVALAVLPIVLISIPFQIFSFKLPRKEFLRMLFGVVPVYAGLLIFLSGIDFGFAFVGQYIGEIFFAPGTPEGFHWLLLPVGFVLGAAITVSEPAVSVLGSQIETLTNGHIRKLTISITLALGIGVAAMLSVLKILTQVNILYFLVPLYAVALVMMKFTPRLFVGLAFDSGGVTGGALTSAFLTPLTLGIAQSVAEMSGSAMSILTNGFGIISFISVTPLIAVQALGIIYDVRSRKMAAAEQEMYDALQALAEDIGAGAEDVLPPVPESAASPTEVPSTEPAGALPEEPVQETVCTADGCEEDKFHE